MLNFKLTQGLISIVLKGPWILGKILGNVLETGKVPIVWEIRYTKSENILIWKF